MSNVALVDPKFLDGEPWEVAGKAGEQSIASIDLAMEALEGFRWAARGAWLSQEDHRTGTMPHGTEFDASPLGQRILAAYEQLRVLRIALGAAVTAASYDPRGNA